MSQQVVDLVASFFDEINLSQRYQPLIQRSLEAGYPQLAKVFEALVASEQVREKLFREKVPHHVDQPSNFFVCPHCGLIYDTEAPERCLVDQTPGSQFIMIQ